MRFVPGALAAWTLQADRITSDGDMQGSMRLLTDPVCVASEWTSTGYLIRGHPQHEFSVGEGHFYHPADAPVPFNHQVLID
jgi:hypothetical protein